MLNKRLFINMCSNILSFLVIMSTNFILTPYIVNNVGSEAYGFVGLANNFVSYAQLITLAFNSLAIRFITLNIHKNNIEEANKYFNSIVITNIIISIVILTTSVFMINNLEKFIDIPISILKDVKLLWIFVFINFIINLIGSTYNISTFATNRLDLNSLRNIQSNILKVIVLIILFYLFNPPHVWYIGFTSILCSIFLFMTNLKYKNKLLPFLKIDFKYFDISKIKELFISGIWSVVTKLGQILSDGLDLLITNLFIDSYSMGILSLSKTIPMAIVSLLSSINNIFSPNITIYYAKNESERLVDEINKSMRISGIFTSSCITILIVLGYYFYKLWVPEENSIFIQTLSSLTIFGMIFTGNVGPLFNIFTVVNKLKLNSIVILINGLINSLLVFIVIKNTNLGVLAVAGISSITSFIRNITYTPIYTAKCLGVKWTTFYPPIVRYIICNILNIFIGFLFCYNFNKYSWIGLIESAFSCLLLNFAIGCLIMLNKNEKNIINNKIKLSLKNIIRKK